MAIFAGVVLATTSCNPFGKDLGDGDGDGDGDGYVDNYWSTDVKESANQVVFTIDYNSGFSGNTIYISTLTFVIFGLPLMPTTLLFKTFSIFPVSLIVLSSAFTRVSSPLNVSRR